ncbi:ATP-binding cassette domain-containing protein [Snodgrassella sp. CFCC 13594]|uniref:ATP-binding cassette domain-containing protein n=1 Tax=Snodgrassella sp. CFCC 13594 TaxID=1775559 RepID=UPI0018D4AF0F|nr:ATP-binding cassette domain-containing protein [Snodgrassella sp. CFCC 13594]
MLLAPEFYAPLRQLGADYHDKAKAEAAITALMPLLDAGTQVTEGGQVLALTQAPTLRLEHVCIDGEGGRIRLPETSFTVAAGEKLLLAGESGSGKSSLLQALLGFTPYGGCIRLNDLDYADLNLTQLREHVGYLAQTPPLLPGSIAENLRLPKPEASDAELIAVLQQVELWHLVSRLPEGIHTHLGERGQGLSGGQLQRLAVAQLLLRQSPLWLLDEPTAHLDGQTAADIQQLLARLSVGKTVLMVSHDTQYVTWLDRVIHLPALASFQGASA